MKNNPIFEKNRMSMTARAINRIPRGYQFGFIYNELSNTKTIAHELCHGAYHLRHTFDEADHLAPEGTTDNLMDYATANDRTFNHWQWQDIHQPKSVRFKWAQDEEGAEGVFDSYRVEKLWENIPYATRIDMSEYNQHNENYDYQYHISSSYGDMQKGLVTSRHKFSKSEIIKEFNIDDFFAKQKLNYLEGIDEKETCLIFETGNGNNSIQNIPGYNKYPGIGSIGLKNVLSEEVYNKVINAFYNKNLDKNFVLEFDATSNLSKDLHINYNFQNDYYVEKVIKYLYKNISNIQLMNKIAKSAQCPNFSNTLDIATYDFYGLMGATQKVDFDIEVYKRYDKDSKTAHYLIQLDFSIHDWFGSDINDIQGGTFDIKPKMACLGAFFWLQHHYEYSPFETIIRFKDFLYIKKEQ